MEKIKVLHCLHSLSWGGLEIYSVELIQKMQAAGFTQMVLCSAHSRVAQELRLANVEVVTFSQPKISKFAEAKLIRGLIKSENFTHLHSHSRLDMWACALALWGKTSVRHFYNLYMNATPKQDFIHKWLFSKVDALCSSSETILEDVKKNFPIAPEKLHLIRYGRDVSKYTPRLEQRTQLRQKYNVQPHQLVLGTLCRIDPGKGVRELITSLDFLSSDELKQVQLWIIGDPTIIGKDAQGQAIFEAPSAELNEWIEKILSNSRFKNNLVRIPFQVDYIPYIEALDVFALASYNETYSLSILDAMMMAKPVIGTNSGGTPEQIGNNLRGQLVKPHDSKSIAEAIQLYLKNSELIKSQGLAAKDWALKNHDWKNIIESFRYLYLNS